MYLIYRIIIRSFIVYNKIHWNFVGNVIKIDTVTFNLIIRNRGELAYESNKYTLMKQRNSVGILFTYSRIKLLRLNKGIHNK